MRLYHYTCVDHGQPGIERDGYLKPRLHPWLPELGPIIWFTDLDRLSAGDAARMGLTPLPGTASMLMCDRTAVRYAVDSEAVPSMRWWPFVRDRCKPDAVADLESYGAPVRWWIANEPVPVRP